jgi:hypothetical protein
MNLKEIENIRCNSNKKISYRQRGAVGSKKHTQLIGVGKSQLEVLGSSMTISFQNGEVVDSAIFEKTVRDCHGNELSVEPVRRFRKIGSDEWFSVPASKGNDFWESRFVVATEEEQLMQLNKNKDLSNGEPVDSSVVEKEEVLSVTKTKELGAENKRETFLSKNKTLVVLAVSAILAVFSYKVLIKK